MNVFVRRLTVKIVAYGRAWRAGLEMEHVIMAFGYLVVAFLGSEQPGVMAFAYGTVGVVHVAHTAKSNARADARERTEDVRSGHAEACTCA